MAIGIAVVGVGLGFLTVAIERGYLGWLVERLDRTYHGGPGTNLRGLLWFHFWINGFRNLRIVL